MKTFKHYLEERFINLLPHHEDKKREHAEEIHTMLQKAYKPIGGIHGSGFNSPEDMVKNIPMWKIHRHEGKIKAVALYKDKEGRKRVAVATDGSEEGKKGLANIMKNDLTQHRSYGETSGKSLSMIKKHVPDITQHALKFDQVKSLTKDPIRKPPENDEEIKRHPELKDHFYQRQIGSDWHTKIMLGTPHKAVK